MSLMIPCGDNNVPEAICYIILHSSKKSLAEIATDWSRCEHGDFAGPKRVRVLTTFRPYISKSKIPINFFFVIFNLSYVSKLCAKFHSVQPNLYSKIQYLDVYFTSFFIHSFFLKKFHLNDST